MNTNDLINHKLQNMILETKDFIEIQHLTSKNKYKKNKQYKHETGCLVKNK